MYLRKITRKNKNGSTTTYLQIAHNYRDPITKTPKPVVLGNLGRADKVDKQALKKLCISIARVCDFKIVDSTGLFKDENDDIKAVVDNIKFIKSFEFGTIQVIEALWERLQVGNLLREIAKKNGLDILFERALLGMTANRLCSPESKLGVWDRWLKTIYFPSGKELKLEHMYRAMDLLNEYWAEVEYRIFAETSNLFNLEVDLIFYDTTTVSFSIDEEDEGVGEEGQGFRKYGHSKEGSWSPQVVVALAVTREGVPVRCWVFPGNTADSSTIQRVRRDLRGWKLGRSVFVADAGVNSRENKSELSRACGKYILATRMSSVSEVKREVLSRRGRFTVIGDNLHAKEVIVGDGERRRRYILCYNPKEARRQQKHREEIVEKLEQTLASHSDRHVSNQWVIELLGSVRYKRYLSLTKGNLVRIDRKKVREAGRYDGKWVIETNDDTINFEDAACSYKGLMVIEQCFRSLKRTQIKVNPVYHWVGRRIEAHIRICFLSLLIQRSVELHCQRPWSRIRELLREVVVIECHTSDHIFFKLNEVGREVREVLKNLEIPFPKRVLGISSRSKND
jgi:transposase